MINSEQDQSGNPMGRVLPSARCHFSGGLRQWKYKTVPAVVRPEMLIILARSALILH